MYRSSRFSVGRLLALSWLLALHVAFGVGGSSGRLDVEALGTGSDMAATEELLGSQATLTGVAVPAGSAGGHPHTADEGVHIPISVLIAVAAITLLIVCVVYARRGITVAFSVCMYLTALSTIKWTIKWVFVTCAFPFPHFLTAAHAVAGGLFVLPILLERRAQTGVAIVTPTLVEMFLMIAPIAAASSISIATNNMALNFCSVAFVMIVGSASCLCTVGMVVLLGMPFDTRLLMPAVAVVVGCAISSFGEINFSFLGMALCFLSNAFRAVRGALQQKLLTGGSREKFDPCSLLFWSSFPAMVLTSLGSLAFEGSAPWRRMADMDRSALYGLILAMGASCVNAAVLNLANLFVTKHLGAVGAQMAGQVRAVLAVLGGVAIFGEPVTRLELFGFGVVLAGVYTFSSMEASFKQQQAEKAEKLEKAFRAL